MTIAREDENRAGIAGTSGAPCPTGRAAGRAPPFHPVFDSFAAEAASGASRRAHVAGWPARANRRDGEFGEACSLRGAPKLAARLGRASGRRTIRQLTVRRGSGNASDQRVVPEQVAVGAPLADADEDVLGQPVVLAGGAFEGGLAAQIVFLVRTGSPPWKAHSRRRCIVSGLRPHRKPRFCSMIAVPSSSSSR